MVDNAQVGTISGTFQASTLAAPSNCGAHAPVVYLYSGAGVIPDDIYNPASGATDTDATGTAEPLTTSTAPLNSSSDYAYTIGFVPAGTYTVAFTCDTDDPNVDESALLPDPIHFTVYSQPVVVMANQSSTANF
jgi:hypothetical protein